MQSLLQYPDYYHSHTSSAEVGPNGGDDGASKVDVIMGNRFLDMQSSKTDHKHWMEERLKKGKPSILEAREGHYYMHLKGSVRDAANGSLFLQETMDDPVEHDGSVL